eukprot:INCI9144.2.p1 GENE.INCI9144.2~~INCI9144.2.p1  ORF type:complete len:390 (-),score=86.70 INCI9144.2:1026-2195(-)
MPYQKGPQKADITPQVRHTNIAVVKYKVKKARFEIACYKNKVVNWRSGVETDIDEVLQMATVFTSVTTGVRATKKSLKKAFGTEDQIACCRVILDKGELQVSDKEREHAFKLMFNEVAQLVAAMCFNPKSQRPYTISLIKDAMIKHQFHLNTGKSAKKQALDCVKFLSRKMDLERMKMLVSITVPATLWAPGSALREATIDDVLETRSADVEGMDVTVQAIIAAESFRRLSTSVQEALQNTDDSLVGGDSGMVDRSLGVTVINPAIEWVSPEARQTATTGGGVTDADFAASIADDVEEMDDGAVHEATSVAAATEAVDRAVQEELLRQQQAGVSAAAPQLPNATPAVANTQSAQPAVPKMSCRKCKAFFDTRKELGAYLLCHPRHVQWV